MIAGQIVYVLAQESWRSADLFEVLFEREISLCLSLNMDRSMAQTLTVLVPTLTGPLPPELLELAVSLLAQSRSKASSLKADEEIARAYACANVACERCELSH